MSAKKTKKPTPTPKAKVLAKISAQMKGKKPRTALEAHQAVMNKKPAKPKPKPTESTGRKGARPHITVLKEYSLHHFVRHLANNGCGRKEAMHVLRALKVDAKPHTVGATISMQTIAGHKNHKNGVKLSPEHTKTVAALITKAKAEVKAVKSAKVIARAEKKDKRKAEREIKSVEVIDGQRIVPGGVQE